MTTTSSWLHEKTRPLGIELQLPAVSELISLAQTPFLSLYSRAKRLVAVHFLLFLEVEMLLSSRHPHPRVKRRRTPRNGLVPPDLNVLGSLES
jgi:hypothetical protein